MVNKLFLDTWGLLTLHDKRESRHQEVSAFYQNFCSKKGMLYTTDYVLDETFTLFFKRLPAAQAQKSMQTLTQALSAQNFNLIWLTPERFNQTQALRLKFLDKPQISFTDLTSMVVMNELGIDRILTEDAHFVQVGMGFQRVP